MTCEVKHMLLRSAIETVSSTNFMIKCCHATVSIADGSTAGGVDPGEEASIGQATEIAAGSTEPPAETDNMETLAEASDAATEEAGGVSGGQEVEAENGESSGTNKGGLDDEIAIQER